MKGTITVDRIIAIANGAYPDGLVAQAAQGVDIGDTLAEFIARELKDTYDEEATDHQKLAIACVAMSSAIRELTAVRDAFDELADSI